MTILIVSVHVVVCLILILVILLQAGRGSGLSWGSFSGNPQSFFGTKSATFLAKATSVSAIVFLVTCISLNIMETRKARSLFSAGKSSPVDVEKIKQVLDKLKAEQKEGAKPVGISEAAAVTTVKPSAAPIAVPQAIPLTKPATNVPVSASEKAGSKT